MNKGWGLTAWIMMVFQGRGVQQRKWPFGRADLGLFGRRRADVRDGSVASGSGGVFVVLAMSVPITRGRPFLRPRLA